MNNLKHDLNNMGAHVQLNDVGLIDWVDLGFKQVDDQSLNIFDDESASRIVYLSLAGTQISERVLSSLQRFCNLEELDLAKTKISGVGFELPDLKELKTLSLKRCLGLSRGGVKHLSKCHKLKKLYLSESNLDDSLIPEISGLHCLERLWIDGTTVSDAGLHHLSTLSRLRWLDAGNTKITATGMEKLRASLPLLNRAIVM